MHAAQTDIPVRGAGCWIAGQHQACHLQAVWRGSSVRRKAVLQARRPAATALTACRQAAAVHIQVTHNKGCCCRLLLCGPLVHASLHLRTASLETRQAFSAGPKVSPLNPIELCMACLKALTFWYGCLCFSDISLVAIGLENHWQQRSVHIIAFAVCVSSQKCLVGHP